MKTYYLILLLVSLTIGCNYEEYQVLEGYAQGTTFRMVYKSSDKFDDEIYRMLKEFDLSLSTYEKESIISRINRNEPNVELDKLFVVFFNKSHEVYLKTNGYFDITVGPLVNAWGFGVDEKRTADSSKIDSIKALVGMDKIEIRNNRLVKQDPRIFIDANAIAQGQSVDYICEFFESKHISNYLVEIGGEVRAKGINDKGEVWRIGIDKPVEGSNTDNRDLQAIVNLNNKSLATSGNYRKFYEYEGIKYSHSINPKTGFPARDKLLSATIIADECSIADAFATACMVMGFEKAVKLLAENKDLEGYFIYAGENGDFEVYQTVGFDKYLSKE